MPVTRLEVAEMVASAFDHHEVVLRDDLIAAAIEACARPEVLDALAHVSNSKFHNVRDLWRDLGHLPVEPVASR